MRLALIELVGYREWTESLGEDREWIIQYAQADTYRRLQHAAANLGAFVLPLRYDYMLVVSTGLSQNEHMLILDEVRLSSRIPVRMVSISGETPRLIVEEAYKLLDSVPLGTLKFLPGNDGLSVMAHVDINGITGQTRREGLINSLLVIWEVISKVSRVAYEHGGVAQYLGGDNIIVLLPDSNYEDFATDIVNKTDVKVGIGHAKRPRKAMELAARALHMIRAGEVSGKINIISEH